MWVRLRYVLQKKKKSVSRFWTNECEFVSCLQTMAEAHCPWVIFGLSTLLWLCLTRQKLNWSLSFLAWWASFLILGELKPINDQAWPWARPLWEPGDLHTWDVVLLLTAGSCPAFHPWNPQIPKKPLWFNWEPSQKLPLIEADPKGRGCSSFLSPLCLFVMSPN